MDLFASAGPSVWDRLQPSSVFSTHRNDTLYLTTLYFFAVFFRRVQRELPTVGPRRALHLHVHSTCICGERVSGLIQAPRRNQAQCRTI